METQKAYRLFIGGDYSISTNDLRNFVQNLEYQMKRSSDFKWYHSAIKTGDIICCEKKGNLLIGVAPRDTSWGFIREARGITVIWDHEKAQS